MPDVTCRPLTPGRWSDFTELFGPSGVGGGCWCMYWRTASRQEYSRNKGDRNKRSMWALLEGGEVPGLLAYEAGTPVGWCAVARREAFPALDRSPSRRAIDSEDVWAITCVYVTSSHRRRGLSTRLIESAVEHVASNGGHIVEAYPVPPKDGVRSTNYAFTGFVSSFVRAEFVECARRHPTRPIMRYSLDE